MRIILFYHSLLSDWNHGNAHFLRGYAAELQERGHDVFIYEPSDGWSLKNLIREHGDLPIRDFRNAYPRLQSVVYHPRFLNLELVLSDADLVIVHEWNDPDLVAEIGNCRKKMGNFRLFFHDTHHRSVTNPEAMRAYDLSHYDGVLAFGETIRQIYLKNGWAKNVWTWHEAADVRTFYPRKQQRLEGDLVWIGNWGDGERKAELEEFLLQPASEAGIRTRIYGVRFPNEAREAIDRAGIEFGGWLPNYKVPAVFTNYCATVHVPRRPYAEKLAGIPTIRMFEAMACGIPLISAPWNDCEELFRPDDYLLARNKREMRDHLWTVLNDKDFAENLAARALETIRERHTCAHRVDQLLSICEPFGLSTRASAIAS
ncbi:MAG TPA: glycosyltransferase [Opitutales bacterium]|nr:glycosyltransferase [Opitutales bacterium]